MVMSRLHKDIRLRNAPETVADPASGSKSFHWEIVIAVTALHLVRILLPANLYLWIVFFFLHPSIQPARESFLTLVTALISLTSCRLLLFSSRTEY